MRSGRFQDKPSGELTKREQEIMILLVQGMSNKDIAARLGNSPFTVRDSLSTIFRKLQVTNRMEAVIAFSSLN